MLSSMSALTFVILSSFIQVHSFNHHLLFNLPINDLSSPLTIHAINQAQKELDETGAFLLPKFLSNDAISTISHVFKDIFNKNDISWPVVHRSIFQKFVTNNELSLDHPFNQLLYNRIGFIGKTILDKEFNHNNGNNLFINLYNSTILQDFLSAIINVRIYPSDDEHGCVYGLVGRNNDIGAWHLDEHPFSCVWVIHKPQIGGNFRYVTLDPEMTENGWQWDIDLLSKILNKDSDTLDKYVRTIDASVGDVYCFWGNVSMHEINEIKDESETIMPRQVFVTAYHTEPHFTHSQSVHALNDWTGTKVTTQSESQTAENEIKMKNNNKDEL